MSEFGLYDELPDDVIEMHERTARNLANLWANGSEGARTCILAALLRETHRMAKGMPAPSGLPIMPNSSPTDPA